LHGFALQAVAVGGITTSELGRRLGISKQAAAKTASQLEQRRYLARRSHPSDGRALLLIRTARGERFLSDSARIFDRLRQRWARELGADRLAVLEAALEELGAPATGKLRDFPGWLQ
ncbi:MAG: MarR family winged helix-turn-helix transcriptional regulator, partial [Solirubrobacteraceae bacterium]